MREGNDEATLGKLYLLPTAEAPVANIHREEILSEKQLPIRYVRLQSLLSRAKPARPGWARAA